MSRRDRAASRVPGLWWCCALLLSITALQSVAIAQPAADGLSVLLSADNEGNAFPCRTCPAQFGPGGLAKRGTLVQDQRTGGRPTLVLDAGNALFGADSMDSSGRLVVSAYDAIGYDAVNMSFRDFRLGPDATRDALKDAKFAAISANLIDDKSGQLLFKPYAIKEIAGHKFAVIGVTDPPAPLDQIPQLKAQLTGIRIRPSVDALAEWLPKAKADAGRVILLYYGPVRTLRAIHKRFGADVTLFAVGGMRPDQVAEQVTPPILASEAEGKSLGHAVIAAKSVQLDQLPVTAHVADDSAVAAVVTRFIPGSQGPAENPPTAPPAEKPAGPPRVAAKQAREPKGLAGVGLTQEQVNQAIDRGCTFTWKELQSQATSNSGDLGGSYEGYHTLEALALVKSGLHKRDPDFNRAVRRYLARVVPESLGTYGAGTLCMLVEAYGDPQYEPVQRRAARYLFESHGPHGWDYNPKVPDDAMNDGRAGKPLQVWGGRKALGSGEAEHWKHATTQPAADIEGDNSLAQYAVMGLQSAARAGVEIPPQTWQQVLDMYLARHNTTEGGWGYVGNASGVSGSMTCAGSYAVTVARFNLGEKDPSACEAVEQGLGWLAGKFTVNENPGGAYHYYYLYSIERLGRTLDTEFIGDHEWYPLGARYLIDKQQPDGSWHEGDPDGHPELTTAFALLFLSRGTPQLVPPPTKHEGPGTLRTALVQPPTPRVYFILDCSGSMTAPMGGKTKFDLARTAISQLLAELPDGTSVALRAYGHRKSALDDGASEDTELLQQLAPLDRQAFADTLAHLRARGKTPLARSLKEAEGELGSGGKIDVVLLTDGGEDTLPRQDPVAAAAAIGKIKDVTLHIVGFDIGDETWGKQLHDMAAAANGRYWPASDGDALVRDLRAALLHSPGTFEVFDTHNKRVAEGRFGDSKQLPPGDYTFATSFSGQPLREPFSINPGMPTAILFDSVRFDVTNQVSATQPAVAPKFCTHCGRRLEPGQKFCPACGQKFAP